MTKMVISPENQLVMLNRYLIDNAHLLPSPVITVGGQAVMYWYATYMDFYPEQPDMTFITSIDVDYVAKKEGQKLLHKYSMLITECRKYLIHLPSLYSI
ncbi:hypothetical protein [Pseudescherichia sp.]|uniref:hypothetical protein n=1 Tax=Pseudescherichia sp. TaxID=2055881 RepID=UPI002897979D|nr:hypothetical protein [Pseudescherichia sp.]